MRNLPSLLLLMGLLALSVIPVHAQAGYQLYIEVQPPVLSADNGEYPIYIMLLSEEGILARAPKNITVTLFTSDSRLLEVPRQVTIPKGSYYVKAYVKTSSVPGQVTITAVAENVEKGESVVDIVYPIGEPIKVSVYAKPSTILPYPDEEARIIVRLEDGLGHPVKAPEDLHVRLTLSDTDLGELPEEAIIPEGLYQTELTFKPKGLVGSVNIIATAIGYEKGETTLYLKAPEPVSLKLYAAPEAIPADGISYGYLAIALVDEEGYPAPTENDVTVFLSSANDAVVTLETNVTVIKKGEYYTMVRFFSTGINGTSEITAHAENLLPDSISVSTMQLGEHTTPNKINLYVIPSLLLPDESTHKGVVVLQLLNEDEEPIIMHNDVTFTLSSSDPRYGNVTRFITVRGGSNIGVGDFYTGHVSGSTKITATADGFETGYFDMEVKTRPPTSLKLEMAPPVLRADESRYDVFIVQLLDSSGNPTRAVNDTDVYLLPSDSTLIDLPAKVTIEAGRSSVAFSAMTTMNHGFLTIYAHSHNLQSASLGVNIEEPYPNDIGLAIEPPYTFADGGYVDIILWVESYGVPAKLERAVNISLFTTNASIIKSPNWILHLSGKAYTISKARVGEESGWADLIALADGFNSSEVPFYTILFPMTVEFNTSAPFIVDQPSPISLHVKYLEFGIPDAYVKFIAENGTIRTTTFLTDEDGWLTFQYVPKVYGKNVIKVTVSAPGYEETTASFEVTATAYPTLTVSLLSVDGMPIKGAEVSVLLPNGSALVKTTDETGIVRFEKLEAGDYIVSVPTDYPVSNMEMLSFSSWQDGIEDFSRTISLIEDTNLIANYVKKYFVLVDSPYGTPQGTGWYAEGSAATISISPQTVQISPFAPPQRFVSWTGDIYSKEPTTTVIVDSPKAITAQWAPDYMAFAITIAPIIAVILVLISIPLLIRKKIKKKEEEIEEEEFF